MINDNFAKLPYLATISQHLDAKLEHISPEIQNSDYHAYCFTVKGQSVRFRVAKTTPKKSGQFVVFWEKDTTGKNQPFHADSAPEILIVAVTEPNGNTSGYFVFPKASLIEHNVLSHGNTNGRMAMRVYPPQTLTTSKQAKKTQLWQQAFFNFTEQVASNPYFK